jgi:large conductance mechanosensitive channel
VIQEFKDFISKGNVLDLTAAVVLAAAFGLVVGSFVNDILMQIVAAIFGQPDFSGMTIHRGDAIGVDPDTGQALYEGQIYYGRFLTTALNFVIVAFVVFMVVKAYNSTQKDEEEEEAGPSEVDLLTEIRDSLSNR